MSVSVLLTAYRESAVIPRSVARVTKELQSLGEAYEIIICDDGSNDDTAAVVAALGDPRVRCVTGEHLGKGGSLSRGVMAATGDRIFYTDVDLAYGTRVIPRFLEALARGADLAIGSRPLHPRGYEGYPLHRKLFSGGYRAALQLLGGIHASDAQCGCKAYTKNAARAIFADIGEQGFAFEFETLLRAEKAGLAVCELPVRVLRNGASHVRPMRDGLRMLKAAMRIRRQYK